jgi:integrase
MAALYPMRPAGSYTTPWDTIGLLSRNCAKDVELPRAVRKRHRVLSQLEAEKLLSAARDTYLYLFILIGFCIGLRRGEIFGLRWPDIDWNSGIISVERQISEGGFVDAPKTAASTRSILLPRILLEELKRHQISQSATRSLVGSSYSTDGYVFASELGLALSPDGMYTLYRSIFARAGVVYLRPHDLRHSAASLLIASGVPITEVAEILGHSSPAVTLAIYAHAIAKTSSKAADAIQRRFDA